MADDLFGDIPAAGSGLFDDVPGAADKVKRPGVRAALKDIQAREKNRPGAGLTQRGADAMTLGLSTQINAGVGAGLAALRGKYSAKDAYDAERLWAAAKRQKQQGERPVLSTAADVVGSLAMPGGKAIGKFVVGKAAPALKAAGEKIPLALRVLQTARASAAAAPMGALQGAALARPGEEVQGAQHGAAWSAALTPVMGGALALGAKAAPPVVRTGQRILNAVVPEAGPRAPAIVRSARDLIRPPSVEQMTTEKLAKALRHEGLRPDAVQAAMDEWASAGGVTPRLLDILKEAGGAPRVLKMLKASGATAPSRQAVDAYTDETVGGVQGKALAEVERLVTGESRTPVQIRADQDLVTAERLVQIDADLAAARQEPPAGAPRETGAAAFADEINIKYDASKGAYQSAFQEAEAARPESAIVPDEERAPIITRIFSAMGRPSRFDKDSQGLFKLVDRLREGELPPPTAEEIAAGRQESPRGTAPLTIADLHDMRLTLGGLAGKLDGNAQRQAITAREAIDGELERLAAEGKIAGDDPAVVEKWGQAILGFAQHKKMFGDGLGAKLTERVPGKPDERVVKPHEAGDVIFGDRAKGVRSLNDINADVAPLLDVVEPRTVQTLQAELYGRIPPEDLPGLAERYPTAAPRLLPKDLVEGSLAAQRANAEAEAAAVAQREAADAEAAVPLDALRTGEQALTMPSEEFAPAVDAAATGDLPVLGSGAKQSVLDYLESPAPDQTARIARLRGAQAQRNLGQALGADQTGAMQARLDLIEKQARNAQMLEAVAGSGGKSESPLVETISPSDLAFPRRGVFDLGLNLLRRGSHLSAKQHRAAVQMLTSESPETMNAIMAKLLEKYGAGARAASPLIAKNRGSGDAGALDNLRQQYGLDY